MCWTSGGGVRYLTHSNHSVMEIDNYTLKEWAVRRYQLVYDGQGVGNYSAWDIIALLDAKQIDLNAQIRIMGQKTVRLGDSVLYKNADKLRALTGSTMQVMLFDSLEKLRVRFLWWSIGVGIMMAVFFLFVIRVYIAQ